MKVTLTIETGVTFYTAIFKRQYSADIEVVDGKVMLYDIRKEDFVPSGYGQGGSRKVICESYHCNDTDPARINDRELMRTWLAHVALEKDLELYVKTGCKELNKSKQIVMSTLDERVDGSEVEGLLIACTIS